MTKRQWLNCERPNDLFALLEGRASERKVRLFAAACCRGIPDLAALRGITPAVEIAEQYADGLLDELHRAAAIVHGPTHHSAGVIWSWLLHREMYGTTRDLLEKYGLPLPHRQSSYLRDVFCNPYRTPPNLDPHWLAWNAGTVARLAQAAYDERQMPAGTLDPARLAVLADALEEAGCNDAALLGHLRQQGAVHVRGCWVIDLLLGKS